MKAHLTRFNNCRERIRSLSLDFDVDGIGPTPTSPYSALSKVKDLAMQKIDKTIIDAKSVMTIRGSRSVGIPQAPQ